MPRFLLIAPNPHGGADLRGLAGDGGGSIARVAPVAIATVAAMAPPQIDVVLRDEALDPIDFDEPADYVGISANVSQVQRALEIAAQFRSRGVPVIIGGPHITLDPEAFAGACDVAVTGEFEAIAATFYADMIAGTLKPHYEGGRPSLTDSPVPAWELYDNERALVGVVQTSRGCPFSCNYCDVIQYLGRVQRHKTNDQVIAEVQRLYELGYNRIALADDNFTVYRRRATSLLEALTAWNGHDRRDHVIFATQVSIDVARDDDILRLCASAGVSNLFIGVETVNETALAAANKKQNLNTDMTAQLRKIVSHGLKVEAALMVGFDSDTKRIFDQQYEFSMQMPVGVFKISALMAPKATPFYDEMHKAGRLDLSDAESQFPGANLQTNLIPAQMSKAELLLGTKWLISRLSSPSAFWQRLQHIADIIGPNPLRARGTGRLYEAPGRERANRHFTRTIRAMGRRHPDVARTLMLTNELMRSRPDIRDNLADVTTSWLLSLAVHVEAGTYDPELALMPAPPMTRVRRAA